MTKLLLLILVLVVAAGIWVGKRRVAGRRAASARLQAIEPCAHCGVHVPMDEAHLRDGKTYCSAAHRELGPPSA